MNEAQVRTLEQVCGALAATQALEMRPVADETGRYAWIETALKRFDYRCLKRADRGLAPLYPSVPGAALKDERLYALLALFDALRAGQARERESDVRC